MELVFISTYVLTVLDIREYTFSLSPKWSR